MRVCVCSAEEAVAITRDYRQRSSQRAIPAAEQLSRLGYDRVHYLAGGYGPWTARP
jgi:hypothetical protein